MKMIEKFGLAVIRNNKLLLCRPYAFPDLIMPGGTKEAGEDYVENLQREVKEELGDGSILNVETLAFLGHFSDAAAGVTQRHLEMDLYLGEITGDLKPSSEIKELVWFQPGETEDTLSPVVANKIIPFLLAKSLLTYNIGTDVTENLS